MKSNSSSSTVYNAKNLEPTHNKWWRKTKNTGLGFALGGGVILLLLASWEALSWTGWVDPQFSSSPSRVFQKGIELAREGVLWPHIAASAEIFIIGFILAVLIGAPIGILLGWYNKLNMAFSPLIAALYNTPRIALMPLFIIWLGMGQTPKIALVFISAIMPIILNMIVGMKSIDGDLTKVAKSYGSTQRQIFWTIALPMSVPFLITALQLAVGRALMGVVASEIFGTSEGIGYMIMYAGNTFQTDTVFVGVFIIAGIGVVLDRTFFYLGRHFDAWRGNN